MEKVDKKKAGDILSLDEFIKTYFPDDCEGIHNDDVNMGGEPTSARAFLDKYKKKFS